MSGFKMGLLLGIIPDWVFYFYFFYFFFVSSSENKGVGCAASQCFHYCDHNALQIAVVKGMLLTVLLSLLLLK